MNNMTEGKKIENPEYLLPKKTTNKKTLVLDLDETLVHSQFQPFDVPSDITLKIELDGEFHDIHVLVRPGVKEFLQNMGKIYEIVIFTASVSKYADPLLDIIDKEKNCKFRLFREHCTTVNACYIKEIQKLGRDLKDVVIVDNSPLSYALNPENGLPIITWFEDKEDRELYNISSILEFLSFVPDVRNYICQFVVNDEISYNNVINVFDRYNDMLNQKKLNKNNVNSNINNNKNKSKDNKKIFNKNNSKIKFNNNHLIPDKKENKENINSYNNIIKNNIININNLNKFKNNLNLNYYKSKNENDIKINLNKKIRQNSKTNNNSNKLKDNKFNPKDIIANVENNENINPNIRIDVSKINQTTKNKNMKNINFNPSAIIASVPKASLNLIPNTTTHKNSFSNFAVNYNFSNNIKLKNKMMKHRKADSTSGLHPKKVYEDNSTNLNKNNQYQHSSSIILEKKKKKLATSNTSHNLSLSNFTNNAQTTKNKNNKQIQLSMRISRDIGQDLDLEKLEPSEDQDDKLNKKLSKSLTREKISISFSNQNKSNININTNNFSNKTSLVKNKTNKNYIYHKKHKSITTSFIPFPSTTKNLDFNKYNKLIDRKPSTDNNTNKPNKNILAKFSKNSYNKHKRFLSSSENYVTNIMNNLYSSSTNHTNHSSIIINSTNNSNINNVNNNVNNSNNNLFMNNLTFKHKQRSSQKKVNNFMDINTMRIEKEKDNYNTNKEKKKEYKIPVSFVKKRNSLNENTFKKKIPINKNNILNTNNTSNNKNLSLHKKSVSVNSDNNGFLSVRPKSSKQIVHLKNNNHEGNIKVGINKGNATINININKKKDISVEKLKTNKLN